MGYYRPRPVQLITCKHCCMSFETRHKRTMYCGESCRQLAYQARHRIGDQQELRQVKGNLDFSVQNMGVTAAGAAVTAVGNYMLNDRPAQQEILSRLSSIEKGTESSLNRLLGSLQVMVDYVNVQIETDYTLKGKMIQARSTRVQNELQKDQRKQEIVKELLAKNRLNR